MIPVLEQSEPADFDAKVRQKGLAFLRKKGIALDQPLPDKADIAPYWRDCLDDLHSLYHGCCAYLAIFIERVTGDASVDHFIAKSKQADLAYEWSNYRLACLTMNSRKRNYDDVLDPFSVQSGWFHLELVSGRIYPNSNLPSNTKKQIEETIERLHLDDAGNREIRSRHYYEYAAKGYPTDYLKTRSPFVYTEALRQGLL
ncbi:MAG: TIGR02646 family protein [Candidatus Electronema aureum]|uniref:TIGR02646 family protein n=1 Tax=Candidatus Electronema aureum TaxID=2005002 RepID=A0A521FZD6_9BACT|nr:MAG: TIGR02646 family protein [Candidatus Electronema aureum]